MTAVAPARNLRGAARRARAGRPAPPRGLRLLAALVFGCLLSFAAAWAADDLQAIPPLTARVTDTTGTLDAAQKQSLDAELAALEQRKGAQLAILIVPTTQPEDIAQYAIRVFDQWKLGRKNIDDGVLLIVAKNDHRVRIEVARGLEGAIPDAAAARIIREYITPKFRSGDFHGGIEDAVGALTRLIDGEPLPPPLQDEPARRHGPDTIFNTLITAIFAAIWLRAMFGRLSAVPRAGVVGVASGGVAMLFSGLLPLAVGAGVLGAFIGLLGGGGGGFANRGGWGGFGGGGLGGGGFGGGGFGGGGFGGGGGFSGGGGISAGGGASGSW